MMGSDEFALRSILGDFKVDRGGIKYPAPTTQPPTESEPVPTTLLRDDEGFIDIRIVLGRDDDPVAHPHILRVERMGYRLPDGTTRDLLDYAANEFYDYPHELIEPFAEIYREIPVD